MGRVVKGVSFRDLKSVGDPVELASRYAAEGADELVFLDISASVEGRETMIDVVRRVASVIDIPFTVGGGIRNLDDAFRLLVNGADKVSINTAAIQNPEIISEISKRFGDQCVVLAIDAKREMIGDKLVYRVYSHSATRPTQLTAEEWVARGESLGAGEILLTSIDMDGRRSGYDIELLKKITRTVNIPVIASGGAGTLEHLYEAIVGGGADGVLAASIFHYGLYSIRQVKEYLLSRGVTVRL